jgi:protein SCO1
MLRRVLVICLVVIALLGAGGIYYFGFCKGLNTELSSLKPLWKIPSYKFINQEGKIVSSNDLKGHIYVSDFFFTRCPGVCLVLSGDMQKLQDIYRGKQDVKLVSFSVDPAEDSVPVLKDYAGRYNADANQWYFLTGKPDSIYKTEVEGFKQDIVESINGTEQYNHSYMMVLVDGNGEVRKLYDGTNPTTLGAITKDISLLEKENFLASK